MSFVLGSAVMTAIVSIFSGIIGGTALALLFGAFLGLIVEFLYDGSIGIVKIALSDKFLSFYNIFDLLPYEGIDFKGIFIWLSILFLILLGAYSFFKSMVASDTRDAQSPLEIVKRIVIALVFMIVFIAVFFEFDGHEPLIYRFMETFKGLVDVGDKLDNTANNIKPYISDNVFSGYILTCILGFMLAKGCIVASFTFVERIVTLIIFVSFGPMAIATYASKDSEEIFKKWLKTIVGTILAIVLSMFLFRLFIDQMGAWNAIETRANESATSTLRVELSADEKNFCIANPTGGTYYPSCSNEGASSGGNCSPVYISAEMCTSGYKEITTQASDEGVRYFTQEANTFRLILAIAWITLCANSEKFINSLGFSSIINGQMARDFIGSIRNVTGTYSTGFRMGQMMGSTIGRSAMMQHAFKKSMSQNATQGGKLSAISLKPDPKEAFMTPGEKAISRATRYGQAVGRMMAINGMNKPDAAIKSNIIAGSGLMDSRGNMIPSSLNMLNRTSEKGMLHGIASDAIDKGYNDTARFMGALKSGDNSYTYKDENGVERRVSLASSLNGSYLADSPFAAKTCEYHYEVSGDREYDTYAFSGTYSDDSGVTRNIDDAVFIRKEDTSLYEKTHSDDMPSSRISVEGGTVYFNSQSDCDSENISSISEGISDLKTDSEKANELLESISETQGYVTGDLEELRDYFIQSEENEDEEEY